MEKLAREKIATQQRLAELKNDLSQSMDVMEIERILRQTVQPEDDQASTSTASGTIHLHICFIRLPVKVCGHVFVDQAGLNIPARFKKVSDVNQM